MLSEIRLLDKDGKCTGGYLFPACTKHIMEALVEGWRAEDKQAQDTMAKLTLNKSFLPKR